MRENIGAWAFWRHGSHIVYIEDGVFKIELNVRDYWYSQRRSDTLRFQRKLGKRFFGNSEFLIGVQDDFVDGFLLAADGKTVEEVCEIARERVARREARNAEYREKQRRWKKLREKFDGVVIGIDSKIDVYDVGFSVRVLFGSDITFAGKKKFLAENRVEFVKWVMHELTENKAARRKIGDIRFYKPVEIINLRAREVEVKFEVKGEVA